MGTWALPQTKKSAKQLAAIMANSINADVAEAALSQIFGDDELSDQINTEANDSDVRYLVAFRLEYFLNDYAERPEAYFFVWESSDLKICQKIVKSTIK